MTITFKSVTPVLRILDVPKAREFYLDYLGFAVEFEHRYGDNFPLYMGIARGALRLHLSEHYGDAIPGANIRIEMSDVAALHGELQAKNYRYFNPGLEDTEWNTREVGLIDPFGNRIRFYEPKT
jgi:uncharacterized glyoxalase superfamily protein PhnB